jgi:hypothetical protein
MLMDPIKTSPYGLKGQKGPMFENISQKTTSDIQALSPAGSLISSQDMISGRSYGQPGVPVAFAPPSVLDLNGQTPNNPSKEVPYLINGPKF